MTRDFSLWKRTVQQAIVGLYTFEVSDDPAQPATAGFQTALGRLYGEGLFTEFLSYQAWRQAGLDDVASEALETLRRELDAYDEPDRDEAIMADPTWWAIMGLAMQVVDLLE